MEVDGGESAEGPALDELRILFRQHVGAFATANASLRFNEKHHIGAAMWVWMIDQGFIGAALRAQGDEIHHGRKTGKEGHPLWRIAFRRTVRGSPELDVLFDGKRKGPTPLYARLSDAGLLPRNPEELIRPRSNTSVSPSIPSALVRPTRQVRYAARDEWIVHPDGGEWLYIYTTTRELTLFAERQVRPLLKIGSTRNDYMSRIAAQAGSTAANSTLVCLHAYRVADCRNLEAQVHQALKARDRHIKDAPGIEWFDVTPDEAHALVGALCGREIAKSTTIDS